MLWRTEAKRLAFTVACRALLGDRISQEDVDHLVPCERAMSEAFFSTVRLPCPLLCCTPQFAPKTFPRMCDTRTVCALSTAVMGQQQGNGFLEYFSKSSDAHCCTVLAYTLARHC